MPIILSKRAGGGGGSAGVSSLDGLTGAVTLSAGSGITLTPTGNDIEVAATGSGAMTAIDSEILAGAGVFDFNNISGTYNHLMLIMVLRSTENSGALARMTLNADGSAIYYRESLSALNTTVAGASNVVDGSALLSANALVGTTDTAGRATHMKVMLPGYKETTFHKDWITESHSSLSTAAGGQGLSFCTGTYGSTSAITRIQVAPSAGVTFVAGSGAWLYGIT